MSTLMSRYSNDELALIDIGIVGYGNVGSRLARCCQYFNLNYHIYDPLLEPSVAGFVNCLDQLMNCDALSLHVPLTNNGEHLTYHLFDHKRLSQFFNHAKKNSLLINSSRGPVVDNAALKACLPLAAHCQAALDVWEGEPNIDTELFSLCALATPHIAGYSVDGKRRGALAVVKAAQAFFSIKQAINPLADDVRTLGSFQSLEDYRSGLAQIYDVANDSKRFARALFQAEDQAKATAFDQYRKHYPLRREINYD